MTVEIPAGAIVVFLIVVAAFLAFHFRAKWLPKILPAAAPAVTPGPPVAPPVVVQPPAPPAPPVPAPAPVDPNNLADFYIDRDDLMKRIGDGWQFAVVIDGVTVHNGFGPADSFTTQPNGNLLKVKPNA